MKKVMIAAAAVAFAGVALAECELAPTPTVTRAAVYAWKFTGKTTVGAIVRSTSVGASSNCQLGTTTVTECAIRVPGTLAIQGYTYYCDNCCDSFASGTAGATIAQFYMTKPFQSKLTTATVNVDVAHIIGKTGTQFEAAGLATFTAADPSETFALTYAGLGSFNKSLKVPTSVSGNFAGKASSPYYVARGVCIPADYWLCDPLPSLVFACSPTDDSVAYGTWSVKYNASASTRYRNNGTTIAIPSWAR